MGIDVIDLPSIFQDKSVTSSISDYFQNSNPSISITNQFPLPLDVWDGLRYFIVALSEPFI